MTPLVNRPIAPGPGRSIGQLAMTPLVNRPLGCHRDREWAIGAAERRDFTGYRIVGAERSPRCVPVAAASEKTRSS
jgi:hypothetical protein